MRGRAALFAIAAGFAALSALYAQRPFKAYPGIEYETFELPKDWDKTTEWTRARLKYKDARIPGFYAGDRYWSMDYPRSDRHLLEGVRRLTRIDARSVEQVVELDGSDDIFNWPIVYAVEVGHWRMPDEEAPQFREYFARGGFLMVDDFHGDTEWEIFTEGLKRVLPDAEIVDLPDSAPIFHVVSDTVNRFQVPGWNIWSEEGITYEQGEEGRTPHWRGVYDKKGRLMVVISHNMDLGDAWEHSDNPLYPERFASLAYRIAMNYFVYNLTH